MIIIYFKSLFIVFVKNKHISKSTNSHIYNKCDRKHIFNRYPFQPCCEGDCANVDEKGMKKYT